MISPLRFGATVPEKIPRQQIIPFSKAATSSAASAENTDNHSGQTAEPPQHDWRTYKLFARVAAIALLGLGTVHSTVTQPSVEARAAAEQSNCDKTGEDCAKASETSDAADEMKYQAYAEWVASGFAGFLALRFKQREEAAAKLTEKSDTSK